MPLATCKRCKKMFNKAEFNVCEKCLPEEDADFAKVRDLIAAEPGLPVSELVERTEVQIEVVKRMLDEEAVKVSEEEVVVKCIQCNAIAVDLEKKLCRKCMEHLNNQMASMQRDIKYDIKNVKPVEEPTKNAIETFSYKRK